MEEIEKPKRQWTPVALFAAMLFCLLFWLIALNADVYAFAIVGALYEILCLPMLVFPMVLPVLLLVLWARRRFSVKSAYLWLLLGSLGLVFFMLTRTL